jgi:signal transduction histidine kinase
MLLYDWLQQNYDPVVEAAVTRLAHSDTLKSQTVETVKVFFQAVIDAVGSGSFDPVNEILANWVASRSATSGLEQPSLLPVLGVLKQVMYEHIVRTSSSDKTIRLLLECDELFTQSMTRLASLESQSLLYEMRFKLQKAEAQIWHLDKSKSNFIAVAAHELRTPLTLVEGYADMMLSLSGANDAQSSMLLTGIKSGAKRLRDIINDIIDVSLLDLRLMEFHFQPIWLAHVINAAERNVKKAFADRHVEIVVDHDTITNEPTYADPDRLLQAFQKILMNAVKYTPDGGRIEIRGRSLPGFTDVTISDTGIGISATHLPYIFDTFSALGDSSLHSSGKTKFKGGGPGLGLPIARGIIEAHGGTIWAESEGHDEIVLPGSTFHIMIPMHSTVPEVSAWRSNNEWLNSGEKRV